MTIVNKKINLLFVEDDKYLSLIIKDFLESKNINVIHCYNAENGIMEFKTNNIDICVLDIVLPGKDGFWLAKEIKKNDKNNPIIFLTSQKSKENIIEGFTLGAEDYIRKPFLPDELYLRINAILTRIGYKNENEKSIFNFGKYSFNYQSQILVFNKQEFVLPYRETELLKLFCENKNEVIDREFLLKKVWGYDDLNLSRSMDVYITKLRKYFKNDPQIKIVNIRNKGFKMSIIDD